MAKGMYPDFQSSNGNQDDYDYIHYTIGDTEVYFVSNQTEETRSFESTFRIQGRQPELWDALTGEIRDATAFTQQNGLTIVPLTLEPYGSVMVVFNKPIDNTLQGEGKTNYPEYTTVKELDGSWEVYFSPELGGPGKVSFNELTDWTTSKDERIKYYSGSATYNKTFQFTPEKNSSYAIQLENVLDVGVAKIKINGTDKGVVWTKPFRVDVTNELVDGENRLEVEVINSWYNRVAGDEMNPRPDQITKTNIVLINDFRGKPTEKISLEPSGLLGPVTIKMTEQTAL